MFVGLETKPNFVCVFYEQTGRLEVQVLHLMWNKCTWNIDSSHAYHRANFRDKIQSLRFREISCGLVPWGRILNTWNQPGPLRWLVFTTVFRGFAQSNKLDDNVSQLNHYQRGKFAILKDKKKVEKVLLMFKLITSFLYG